MDDIIMPDFSKCSFYRTDFLIEKDDFRGDRLFLDYIQHIQQGPFHEGEINMKARIIALAEMRNLIKLIAHPGCNCKSVREVGLRLLQELLLAEGSYMFHAYCSIVNRDTDDVAGQIRHLHTKKNHDYASGLGMDALANFMFIAAIEPKQKNYDIWDEFYDIALGFVWRMGDKVSRMVTYNRKGMLVVENEGYEDAILDYVVYIGLFYAFITRVIMLLMSRDACKS